MKKYIATGMLLSTLLVSNGIITYQYKVDTEDLKNKITFEKELSKSNYLKFNQAITKQQSIINDQNKTIQAKSSEIHNLQQKLQNATTRNESPSEKLNMEVTAYISNCKGCSGLTLTEYNVRNTVYYEGYRVVAADLNVLPLYSIIEIQTDTQKLKCIVIDKGGAIKGHILDLLVGSYDEAIQFGRQNAVVKVIRKGKGDV